MKNKIFIITMALFIMFCAAPCFAKKITMRNLMEANSMKKLLENYESFTEVLENGLVTYGDKDLYYIGDEVFQEIYTKDIAYSYESGNEFPYAAEFLIDCGEWMGLKSIYSWFGFSYDITALEEIKSVKKSGNVLYVETFFSTENLKKYANRLDYEYTDGDYGINIYEVDKKTLAILGMEGKFYHKDGSVAETFPSAKTYFNQPKPKEAVALLDYVSKIKEKRTVTIVLNPGTENEKTETTYTAKGDPMFLVWSCAPNGAWKMFTDYECTNLATDNYNYMEDCTVYVKKVIEE